MTKHQTFVPEHAAIDVKPFVLEKPWVCPRCGAAQLPSEVKTIEIIEPGRSPRVEFHGRIRPEGSLEGYLGYSCLVCGHVWDDSPDPEDPTPGGSAITFLHPVLEEDDDCCGGACCDRDAC